MPVPDTRLRSSGLDPIKTHPTTWGSDSGPELEPMPEARDSEPRNPKPRSLPEWTIQICGLVILDANKSQPSKGHWVAFLTLLATSCFGKSILKPLFSSLSRKGLRKRFEQWTIWLFCPHWNILLGRKAYRYLSAFPGLSLQSSGLSEPQ